MAQSNLRARGGLSVVTSDVETEIINGLVDPGAGGGVTAAVGSIYMRNIAGVDGGELYLKFGDDATDWIIFASSSGSVSSEDGFQNTYMGKTAGGGGNENPSYSSTNIISGNLTTAIGALDAEIGAAVTPETRTNFPTSDQAVNLNIDALDSAIGTDAQLASTNIIAVANSLNTNVSALDAEIGAAVATPQTRTVGPISDQAVNLNIEALDDAIGANVTSTNIISTAATVNANLSSLDSAVSALQSGLQWLEECLIITADDLSSRTGTGDNTFSDNNGSAPTLAVGDRIASTNDDTIYIVQAGAWTTAAALTTDDTFFVENNYLDPVNQEKGAAFRYDGANLIKVADFDFELADSINLTSGYSAVNGTVTASETIESAIQKLDGNQLDLTTLTGVAQGAVDLGTFTGTTIADNVTIKVALQDLETGLENLDLNDVLSNDPSSGTNDILMVDGQAIRGTDGATGGTLLLVGGDGTTTVGGDVTINGGAAFATSGAVGGDINITGGAGDGAGDDGNINIGNTQTNNVLIHGLIYPDTDGTDGQVITTDGAGNLIFEDPGAVQSSQDTVTNTIITLDSVLVDEVSSAKWLVSYVDASNSRRNAVEIYATHNGLTAADATDVDHTEYALLRANGNITAVSFDVDVSGTGVTQVMRLRATVTAASTVDIRAARVQVNA